jgi:hypothetical protein
MRCTSPDINLSSTVAIIPEAYRDSRRSRCPRGIIDIVVNEGRIFFQERWQYNWVTSAGEKDWILAEKRAFHYAVDNQIWRFWFIRTDHGCAR